MYNARGGENLAGLTPPVNQLPTFYVEERERDHFECLFCLFSAHHQCTNRTLVYQSSHPERAIRTVPHAHDHLLLTTLVNTQCKRLVNYELGSCLATQCHECHFIKQPSYFKHIQYNRDNSLLSQATALNCHSARRRSYCRLKYSQNPLYLSLKSRTPTLKSPQQFVVSFALPYRTAPHITLQTQVEHAELKCIAINEQQENNLPGPLWCVRPHIQT